MVDVSSNSPFRAEARLGLPSASPHRGRSIRARTPSPHTPSAAGATHAGPASVRAATPTTVPRVPRVNLRHVRGAPRGRVPTLGTGAGRGAPLSKRTMQIAPDPDEDDAAGNGNGNGHGEPTPSVRVEVSDHDSQSSSHPVRAVCTPHTCPSLTACVLLLACLVSRHVAGARGRCTPKRDRFISDDQVPAAALAPRAQVGRRLNMTLACDVRTIPPSPSPSAPFAHFVITALRPTTPQHRASTLDILCHRLILSAPTQCRSLPMLTRFMHEDLSFPWMRLNL